MAPHKCNVDINILLNIIQELHLVYIHCTSYAGHILLIDMWIVSLKSYMYLHVTGQSNGAKFWCKGNNPARFIKQTSVLRILV